MIWQTGWGDNVLKDVMKRHAGIKVVVPTNCTDEFYGEACKRAHADHFFDKPFQLMRVLEVFSKWSS